MNIQHTLLKILITVLWFPQFYIIMQGRCTNINAINDLLFIFSEIYRGFQNCVESNDDVQQTKTSIILLKWKTTYSFYKISKKKIDFGLFCFSFPLYFGCICKLNPQKKWENLLTSWELKNLSTEQTQTLQYTENTEKLCYPNFKILEFFK